MIPKQLQKPEFRFCMAQGKRPIEQSWNTTNNRVFNDSQLQTWIRTGNNYFVVCGFGNLLVVDIDAKQYAPQLLRSLFPTFTIKTGSGGFHLYFIVDDDATSSVIDKNEERIIDLQGVGKGVVGAGSIHPDTKKKYVVFDDRPIARITRKLIVDVISNVCEIKKDTGKQKQKRFPPSKNVKISQILRTVGINPNQGQPTSTGFLCDTPLANSIKKRCFHYNDDEGVWYCHHTKRGGTSQTLIEEVLSNAKG